MSSTQKLQTTSEGDFWKYYPGVQVSDYYVSSENSVKPAEKAQSGTEIKFSIPIALGTTTTTNLPLGNYHFVGNMGLRITGTRGRNHSPVNCPLPGMDANVKVDTTGNNFTYKTPTGNFLPMNGYDLIEEIQLTLPGDDYYVLKGEDIFLWCMSQCESSSKRKAFWETCRIDPPVDRLACDEYPDVLLYGTTGSKASADAATDLMGGVTGRQRVISTALSVPFECVLMLPFPWCSPNKDRRPKPFPTYKFGNSQQVTMNITWKRSDQINEAVTLSHAVAAEEWQVIPSTCDLHFEYFNFANKAQLSTIDAYTYPAASLYPLSFKSGALKTVSGGGAAIAPITYTMLVNGLRAGETSHLLIAFTNETGEMVTPSSFELNVGGQIIFKQVDTDGKLAKFFEIPYDDVSEEFYDKRFKFVADANKYQGGNETTLSLTTNASGTIAFPTTNSAVIPAVANINLEKKAITGLPICNYLMIPMGRNACSSNYHNYALGARFDGLDVQLNMTFKPYWNVAENVFKNVNVTEVKVIQVMNGFWQFNNDKVKLFR